MRSDVTKLVALGIGNRVDEVELSGLASDPDDVNVIRVDGFSQLNSVEERLRQVICLGQYSVAVVIARK